MKIRYWTYGSYILLSLIVLIVSVCSVLSREPLTIIGPLFWLGLLIYGVISNWPFPVYIISEKGIKISSAIKNVYVDIDWKDIKTISLVQGTRTVECHLSFLPADELSAYIKASGRNGRKRNNLPALCGDCYFDRCLLYDDPLSGINEKPVMRVSWAYSRQKVEKTIYEIKRYHRIYAEKHAADPLSRFDYFV